MRFSGALQSRNMSNSNEQRGTESNKFGSVARVNHTPTQSLGCPLLVAVAHISLIVERHLEKKDRFIFHRPLL